ncbi:MAG: hypothetical protein F4051_16045, partial [Boseongicola sp. SB0670_bin_30]|nr:hypothetical protein [Boseongicola sp. SB0670_bin_30]
PLPDMEQEGPAPAREDVERDLGDADGSPPEAVEYGQAPAPASEHEDEESADSPPAPVDADTRAANVNAPPAADEETERTSDAKDRGDATGASEAPKSDSPAQSGDIDPSAIEDDFDPHWTEADPDPVSGPAASRSKTARDADGMGEAPANAREGKEATAPGVAKGGENVDTGKEGTRTSSGPENVAAREPEGDRVRTGGPDAGGGDDDDQVPVPVAAPGAPPDASDIDPPAIKIEDDFELLWATADPAPFPSGPDERTESDPGDHAVGDTWTREDAVRFMGLHYAGMSLADIAEELGKSRASVAAWEERQRARGLVPDSAGAGNEAASTGDGEAEDDGPGGPA